MTSPTVHSFPLIGRYLPETGGVMNIEVLSGPITEGASNSRNLQGGIQSKSTPYGGWVVRVTFHPVTDEDVEEVTGWMTALQSGANWTRLPWSHVQNGFLNEKKRFPYIGEGTPTGLIMDKSQKEPSGFIFDGKNDVVIMRENNGSGEGYADTRPFGHESTAAIILDKLIDEPSGFVFHGKSNTVLIRDGGDILSSALSSDGFKGTPGEKHIAVTSASAIDTNIVNIDYSGWALHLKRGSVIGFGPNHFGPYKIMEVLDEGKYKIWPPLHKAIDTSDFCTIRPVAMMRMAAPGEFSWTEDVDAAHGLSVVLAQVFDYHVRGSN